MTEENYPYWRRVWQITSGSLKNVSKQEVQTMLFDMENDILKGVLQFKKSDSDKDVKLNDKQTEDISYFINRTAEHLNVSTAVAWDVLKSYIVNEYCGSIKNIQKMKYEMQILPILNNCWRFFTSERMFLIKTFKNIIEFMDNKEHPFSDIYKAFVLHVKKETIWETLVEEMEYLITEIQSDVAKKMPHALQKNWVQRNMQELIEIIHCLIIFTQHAKIQISQFHNILVLCKKHGFGYEPLYFCSLDLTEPYLLSKLRYSEIALLLCIANELWIKKEVSLNLNEKDLNAEISPLAYRQEHGAVCYIWTTLQLTLKNKHDFDEKYFHKYAQRAVTLDCFKFFAVMISNEMFQDGKSLIGTYVQIALYNMFAMVFENFDMCTRYFHFVDIAEIMKELLKNLFICEQYFRDIKFLPLWLTAVEMYPLQKNVLSKLAEAIIVSDASVSLEIINTLFRLPWYTEFYDPSKIHHTQKHNNSDMYTVKILAPRTISNPLYTLVIPMNSEAIIKKECGAVYIHYKKEINYWLVLLAEINALLGNDSRSEYYTSVTLGLRIMLAILKTRPNVIKENTIFNEIIMLLFGILEKYSDCTENKPLEMLTTCMDIYTELLPNYGSFICSQMETFNLLPTLAKINFTYKEIFHINFIEPGKLGHLIVRSEREQYHDLFLISYLKFLRTSFMVNNGSFHAVEFPGLVFVLKEIFPHFMLWYAKRDRSYIDVLYQIIHFLFEIFQCSSDESNAKEYKKMRKIAYESFLNETCGRCLLRILSVGNVGLQNVMEGQTNWRSGRGIKYISVIQKVMSILMQLLTQRKNVFGDNGLTPLEHMIYTESDGVHSVQAIASFLNHPFNEAIPHLACRLLKKCTVELQMSMLAVLDLGPDQVRMMFIQRLRDHLECDEMKLAIIELISASVPKQPGMTEAFFKVTSTSASNSNLANSSTTSLHSFNEGIGSFLVEYLYKFSSENTTINSPLLSRIMELFHVLWMHQKEILIADIVKDEQFWPSLCCSLFQDICLSDKTYAEILNIIGKEIHKRSGEVDEPLKTVLFKFFSITEPYLEQWLKHVTKFNEQNEETILIDEMPPSDCLMLSFKDLLIISIKFLPPSLFCPEMQIKITEECRTALKDHILNLNDNLTITFLTELYLFLLKNWGDSCFKNDIACYNDIVGMVQKVAFSYANLPIRFCEAILTVAVLSLRGLRSVAISHPSLTRVFIESISVIFNHEYNSFLVKYNNKELNISKGKYNEHKSFVMCFEALNDLMIIQNSTIGNEYNQSFNQSQLLYKFIDCVKKFIENKNTLDLTKIAIESLINYAQSSNSNDFLSSDIDILLWEKLQTPTQFRNPKYFLLVHVENFPWELREWWTLYRRIIMLLHILLKKHSYKFLTKILMFVSLHEEYISEILLLQRYTVEITALDLMKVTLIFLYELFKYQKSWRLDHEQSLLNILDAVKMNLNYSSAILVRPTVLKYYTSSTGSNEENLTQNSLPSELLVEIMNKLTDIISLAIYCILEFSPPLYRYLRDHTDYSSWPLQVGASFGIPTFGDNESCGLTFGLLICLASVYVRILQQMSSSRKTNQVTSPREILVARKSRSSRSEEPKDKSAKLKPTEDSSQKTTEDATPTSEKDSQFCFSQIKRLASKSSHHFEGFIRVDYLNPTYIVSAVENFSSYTSPIKTFPWYAKLSEEGVYRALENVITLIAAQVTHILYPSSSLNKESRLIKRELSSELQTFHEFVKRRLIETQRYISSDRSLFRKKFGVVEEEVNRSSPEKDLAGRRFTSKRSLNMTGVELLTNLPKNRLSFEDRVSLSSAVSSLFEVKLVNEDYLHLLSIWFSYFLHYE